jgi:hypothetical protein
MENVIFSRMLYGYLKIQNLILISNPLKSCEKNYTKKVINEKVTENEDFDFYYCDQKFSAYNFICVIFCTFFDRLNSASNFSFYDSHTKCFCLYNQFLLTLKLISEETAQENEKRIS